MSSKAACSVTLEGVRFWKRLTTRVISPSFVNPADPCGGKSVAGTGRHAAGNRNVRAVFPAGDQLPRLSQPSLAEPSDPDGFPVEFEVNRMAILAAAPDPDRRREYRRHGGFGAMGNVDSRHVVYRKA